jgi:AbrB family looped-hinge helix DNA binding protein
METTRLSSKGQVILPKSIRAAHRWAAGVQFAVIDTADGVLLRPLKPYPPTRVEEVVGSTGYAGPAKTLQDMEDAIARGARDSRDRG